MTGFISTCGGALVTFLAGALAQSVGMAIYETSSHMWNYVLINPNQGYFKYHPEDTDKVNSMENIVKRIKAYKEDLHSGRFANENIEG